MNDDEYLAKLRDQFAGQAMAAMLAAPMGKFSWMDFDECARDAWVMAAKMMAAREVKP